MVLNQGRYRAALLIRIVHANHRESFSREPEDAVKGGDLSRAAFLYDRLTPKGKLHEKLFDRHPE